jgi:2'-5' RNA ligase
MSKIRTFISIPLPQDILTEIGKIRSSLPNYSRGIKWVKPQSIHLTLKFLGNLTEEERAKVFLALDEIFRYPKREFQLEIAGVGAFPNLRRPRVLWAGIDGKELSDLIQLQQEIEQALVEQGFSKENRRFSPHLTIARIKDMKKLAGLIERFQQYRLAPVEFQVREVRVMRSDLKPSGAEYSVQKSYRLSADN